MSHIFRCIIYTTHLHWVEKGRGGKRSGCSGCSKIHCSLDEPSLSSSCSCGSICNGASCSESAPARSSSNSLHPCGQTIARSLSLSLIKIHGRRAVKHPIHVDLRKTLMDSVNNAKRRIGLSIEYIAQRGSGNLQLLSEALLGEMLVVHQLF